MPKIYASNAHASNDYTTTALTGPEQQDLYHGTSRDFWCDDEKFNAVTTELNGFDDVSWYSYNDADELVSGGNLNTGPFNDLALPREKGNIAILYTPGALGATVTGIAGGYHGRRVTLINAASSAFGLALSHQNTNSNSGNRMILPGLGGVTVAAGDSITLVYDGNANRWRKC